MDGRGGGHYQGPPPTTSSLGVSFPSSGALNEAAAAAAGEKVGYTPLRRSFSLSAIGQGGTPQFGRHENLVAVCLLTIALLCLGVMLYVLRPILIPFAVSLLFYYLLQPIVNTLNQPPAVCCRSLTNCLACIDEDIEEEEEEEEEAQLLADDGAAEATRGIDGAGGRRPHRHRSRGGHRRGEGSSASSSLAVGIRSWLGDVMGGLLPSSSQRRGYEPVAEPQPQHDEEQQQPPHDAQGGGPGISPHTDMTGSTTTTSRLSSSQRCWLLWYRARCPRGLSVLLAISIALGVFTAFGMIIYHSVQSLQRDWPIYEMGAERAVAQINAWLDRIHVSLNDDLVPYIMDSVKGAIPTLLSDVWIAVANGALVLIFLVYLLGSPPQELPPGVWRKIDVHIRRYIRLKTFVCGIIGLFVGVVLYLLQVPFAGLFALMTFVLNYIPNFGPIVATLLPLPLVLFSPDLHTPAKVLALVLPSLGHFFVGYNLEPRLFGEHLEVHPIIIILSLAFWSVLWGVSGMILSVPLIAIMRIVCQNLDHPYARVAVRIMEGRLLDFEDQGYIPTPKRGDEGWAARQRRRRREQEDAREGPSSYASAQQQEGGGLRRRHGHGPAEAAAAPIPPAIAPIGVAPASVGTGGGK